MNKFEMIQTQIACLMAVQSSAIAVTEQLRIQIDNSQKRLLLCPVDDLELGTRMVNGLKMENIYYIGDLIQITDADLIERPMMGPKSLKEINRALASRGLALGTKLDNWVSPATTLQESATT